MTTLVLFLVYDQLFSPIQRTNVILVGWGLALGRRVRPTKLCTDTGKSERLVSESSTNKIRTQALQQTAPIA